MRVRNDKTQEDVAKGLNLSRSQYTALEGEGLSSTSIIFVAWLTSTSKAFLIFWQEFCDASPHRYPRRYLLLRPTLCRNAGEAGHLRRLQQKDLHPTEEIEWITFATW